MPQLSCKLDVAVAVRIKIVSAHFGRHFLLAANAAAVKTFELALSNQLVFVDMRIYR